MCLLVQRIPVQKLLAFFIDCLALKCLFLVLYAFVLVQWVESASVRPSEVDRRGLLDAGGERIWSSGAGFVPVGSGPRCVAPSSVYSSLPPVLLLHSTKGLIFCMISPPPVLLLAPGPRLGSNTPSINTSKFLAESHQNETEKGESS